MAGGFPWVPGWVIVWVMEDTDEPILVSNSDPIPAPIPKRGPGNPNMRKGERSLNPLGPAAMTVDQKELLALRERVAELEGKDEEIAELREKLEGQTVKGELKVALARVAELESRERQRAAEDRPDPASELVDELLVKCLEEARR